MAQAKDGLEDQEQHRQEDQVAPHPVGEHAVEAVAELLVLVGAGHAHVR
jgi:hypothetical protein